VDDRINKQPFLTIAHYQATQKVLGRLLHAGWIRAIF
jgi:hypothetical protein